MQRTPINIFVQRGHDKNTWELGNLGNSLSNSLVTVKGVKLLTNNPWCDSDQLSKSLVLGTHVEKKYSCLKPAMIFLFSNFLVLTNSWLENSLYCCNQ